MLTVSSQARKTHKSQVQRKERSYTEVIEYLDSCKPYEYSEASIKRMKALDKQFDNASSKIETILVAGSNGKSSAIHFASKLLIEEGFSLGAAYSDHFLTYNERLSLNNTQPISNKAFAIVVNQVINVVESLKLKATAFEIITMSALLYFKAEGVDVLLLEVAKGGALDATTICNPLIAAVTRVAHDHTDILSDDLDEVAHEMVKIAKKNTRFISAEQSKIRLQKMKTWVEEQGAQWGMPIRKLALLPYIFEQLYGRSASLGERIAQVYVEELKEKFSPFLRGNLLATKRGQRGRPTLEAKREATLNPIKTLKSFWAENFSLLRGRFEVLDKEKPTLLLSNARNVDAFENLFLGIRLLHYQHPIKGLSLFVGFSKSVDLVETMKRIRYLLKKVNGQVFFVELPGKEPGYDVNELLEVAKRLNVKAQGCQVFSEGFDAAKNVVDDRDGLVCITGSSAMVQAYWRERGIKKL